MNQPVTEHSEKFANLLGLGVVLIARECDPATSDVYVGRHSTREFSHIHGNCDSVFVASRTFGTAPLPRRKETRVDEEGQAAENCKIGTGRRTKFHVQPIPTYD